MFRAALAALCLAGPAAAACSDGITEFRWDGGQARFAVEVADDPAERAKGLMFRDTLPASSGMLFVYERAQPVSFWMKNTLIPLDMIFIGADGVVRDVHAEAVPGDLTPIPGSRDTLMVLEIQGGLAAKLGLGPGAEMRHPALDPAAALWSCGQP